MGGVTRALWLLGEVAAHGEPSEVEQAEVRYRQALALADELGIRPLVAHCHLGLGKLYLHTDKREQAQEHLTTAATMYREMDMCFRLEEAEVEMGGVWPPGALRALATYGYAVDGGSWRIHLAHALNHWGN